MLLAQRLHAAGLAFIKVVDRRHPISVEQVVCETEVDAIKVKSWILREAVANAVVRVATTAEREQYRKAKEVV